ncbi:DNA-binding protein [Corynebacterium phocae]|uniref:Cytokinin riboside 5'-monophosphate phosphoribohydrolase n=1 Tax=Corynebacterium phocae TaxID=161895 RepID=A0A1L7D0K4_9CORY|nr:TIGR00730 family Rossman fold protein [Corynebacterium phocae]APT91627.1 DNA-binding protein [Corynebacterium phocae]KAA8720705.1 TIGR00730 family Rossman fold protein [Corynebacterium phocae]
MKNVAVYCGSSSGNRAHFAVAARKLGAELARRDIGLVYGGGRVGLMGEIADAVLAGGGQVTGVIPRQLADLEVAHQGLTRLECVETMAQRKTRMEELADGFIAMPGGVGTLEELAEVLTMQQLGTTDGPVAFLDVAGYWQPFRTMFAAFAKQGFMQQRYVDNLIFSDNPADLLDLCQEFRPLGPKWQRG